MIQNQAEKNAFIDALIKILEVKRTDDGLTNVALIMMVEKPKGDVNDTNPGVRPVIAHNYHDTLMMMIDLRNVIASIAIAGGTSIEGTEDDVIAAVVNETNSRKGH